ncbi:hypothetical protein [Dongia sp. agr-C8]
MSGAETAIAAKPTASSRAIGWFLAGLFLVFAIGLHILFAFKNGVVVREHGLGDTDGYMRVLRIMDLYNGGGWYDTVTARLGAPEGLSLHWTRPVDVLILLPALLAHLFGAPVDRAVYWIGAGFSSAGHIAACFAAAWAAKPLWPKPGYRFAAVILLTNAAAFGYGMVGRPDHHTLLLLLTALMLGAMLRAALAGMTPRQQQPGERRWAGVAGLYAGFGVWVSPEMMVPIVPVIVTLGLFWLDAPLDKHRLAGEAERDWAALGAAFSLAMAAVILVSIPIEHPPSRWLTPEYDKVSIPYLVLPLLWAAVFLLAQRVRGGVVLRSLAGAGLGVIGLAVLLLLYPDLLLGPLGVDPRLKADFLDSVNEMQPLWPTGIDRLRNFLPLVGQSVIAIVLLPFAFRAWGEQRRWSALLLTMAFGFMLIGALLHARLGVELAPSVAIICAGFFFLAETKMRATPRLLRTPALVLVAVGLTCGPLFAAQFLPPVPQGAGCPTPMLAEWLNSARPGKWPAGGGAPIIMTDDISYAPELAFRTPYRFVAGPYHRNPQAIFDTADAMRDQGGETARAILEKRQVSLVIRCIDVVIPRLYTPDHFNFYADLGRAHVPSWLTRIELPMDLSPHYRIYEVNGR